MQPEQTQLHRFKESLPPSSSINSPIEAVYITVTNETKGMSGMPKMQMKI